MCWPTTGDRWVFGSTCSAPGARDRVATFTSVSGPSQDQLVEYIFSGSAPAMAAAKVCPGDQSGAAADVHGVLLDTGAAVAVLRATLRRLRTARRSIVDNIPDEQIRHSENLASDAARSVKTYPANYFRSFSRAGGPIHSSTFRCNSSSTPTTNTCGRTATTTPRAGCRGCGAATSRRVTSRRCRTRR